MFIYCFSIVYFDYIRAIEKNKFVDFDVQTVTAGDYTIEFDLDQKCYSYFKTTYYDEDSPMSELAQFRYYIRTELEERVSQFPDMGFDEVAFVDLDASMVQDNPNNSILESQKSRSKRLQRLSTKNTVKEKK